MTGAILLRGPNVRLAARHAMRYGKTCSLALPHYCTVDRFELILRIGTSRSPSGPYIIVRMNTEEIVETIDVEIARLEKARDLLSGSPTKAAGLRVGSGRITGNGRTAGNGKRTMSPEGRARIAAAQKARWAKSRAGK